MPRNTNTKTVKSVRRAQLSKVEREVTRVETVLGLRASGAAGTHADQNRHRGGKAARGGRQGERRGWAADAS
jgi:hypothetical protein